MRVWTANDDRQRLPVKLVTPPGRIWIACVGALLVCGPVMAADLVLRGGHVVYRGPELILRGGDFSVTGQLYAVGGDAVRIFHVDSGDRLKQFWPTPLPRPVEPMRMTLGAFVRTLTDPRRQYITKEVAFSPASQMVIATGGDDGVVRLWHLPDREPIWSFEGHAGGVSKLAFSPTGKRLAVVSSQHKRKNTLSQLNIWDLQNGQAIHQDHIYNDESDCVSFLDDQTLLFALNDDKSRRESAVEFFDLATLKTVKRIPFGPGSAQSISISKDHERLLISGGECIPLGPSSCQPTGRIWLADIDSDKLAKLMVENAVGYFAPACWVPGSDRFVVGTRRREGRKTIYEIQMRSAKDAELVWSVDLNSYPSGLNASPSGKLIAYGARADRLAANNYNVFFLSAETGQTVKEIKASEL
ncbi:MAG: hypothetical protein HKN47_25175 [Pirellulaceae bacterium]|nr:hypothetical protein [Pirellulaceae bacterium]